MSTSEEKRSGSEYPLWLADIFFSFGMTYGAQWLDLVDTEKSKQVQMGLWYEILKDMPVEYIKLAEKEAVKRHPSFCPKVGEFFLICNEFKAKDERSKTKWVTADSRKYAPNMKESTASLFHEMSVGARIATVIKNLKYAAVPWSTEVSTKIANDLVLCKKQARAFYPNDDEVELLGKMELWDARDFQDVIGY